MNTNKRLNCYFFSNLIIGVLSLNMLVNDSTTSLVYVQDKTGNTLNRIYEKEVISEVIQLDNNISNEVTTINVSAKSVQSQNTKQINYIKPSYNSVTGNSLVNYAKHYLGLRYVSGGYSLTTGTDCSGFTKLIFKEFGINIGRTVSSQIYSGTYVSKHDLKPGDLVFYGHTSSKATHVGIYMGSGLVIHQSKPGDVVKINSVDMMVYITARRLITEDIKKVVSPKSEETKEENITDVKEDTKEEKDLDTEIKEQVSETKNDKLQVIEKNPSEKTTNNDKKEDTKEIETEEKVVEETKEEKEEETNPVENIQDEVSEDLEVKQEEIKEVGTDNTTEVKEKEVIITETAKDEEINEVSEKDTSLENKNEESSEIQK